MSNSLGSIKGRKESIDITLRESTYSLSEMHITSFYGGEKRGRCLQFTIPADREDGFAHIQLTSDGVNLLQKILKDWIGNSI
jgi:hypothetical protein